MAEVVSFTLPNITVKHIDYHFPTLAVYPT